MTSSDRTNEPRLNLASTLGHYNFGLPVTTTGRQAGAGAVARILVAEDGAVTLHRLPGGSDVDIMRVTRGMGRDADVREVKINAPVQLQDSDHVTVGKHSFKVDFSQSPAAPKVGGAEGSAAAGRGSPQGLEAAMPADYTRTTGASPHHLEGGVATVSAGVGGITFGATSGVRLTVTQREGGYTLSPAQHSGGAKVFSHGDTGVGQHVAERASHSLRPGDHITFTEANGSRPGAASRTHHLLFYVDANGDARLAAIAPKPAHRPATPPSGSASDGSRNTGPRVVVQPATPPPGAPSLDQAWFDVDSNKPGDGNGHGAAARVDPPVDPARAAGVKAARREGTPDPRASKTAPTYRDPTDAEVASVLDRYKQALCLVFGAVPQPDTTKAGAFLAARHFAALWANGEVLEHPSDRPDDAHKPVLNPNMLAWKNGREKEGPLEDRYRKKIIQQDVQVKLAPDKASADWKHAVDWNNFLTQLAKDANPLQDLRASQVANPVATDPAQFGLSRNGAAWGAAAGETNIYRENGVYVFAKSGADVVVGTANSADIQVTNQGRSTAISPKHVRVWEAEDRIYVQDLGSARGTEVDGVSIWNIKDIPGIATEVDPGVDADSFTLITLAQNHGAEEINLALIRVVGGGFKLRALSADEAAAAKAKVAAAAARSRAPQGGGRPAPGPDAPRRRTAPPPASRALPRDPIFTPMGGSTSPLEMRGFQSPVDIHIRRVTGTPMDIEVQFELGMKKDTGAKQFNVPVGDFQYDGMNGNINVNAPLAQIVYQGGQYYLRRAQVRAPITLNGTTLSSRVGSPSDAELKPGDVINVAGFSFTFQP